MATIVTIAAGDLISNSRTDLNTNFTNLNADKIETSVLDTDTALAANSDSKVATQKATKTYIDTLGGANASETVRGIVEEATDAEVTAGTATGGTGAKLIVTPAKLATRFTALGVGGSITSLIPLPDFFAFRVDLHLGVATNTTMQVARYVVPIQIIVSKISFWVQTHTTNGTFKIACYSEDGGTKKFEVTTASVTGAGVVTTAVSAVTLAPGIYYFCILPVSTASTRPAAYNTADAGGVDPTSTLYGGIASEPDRTGTITVTADTIPSTIDPTAITAVSMAGLVWRLDN